VPMGCRFLTPSKKQFHTKTSAKPNYFYSIDGYDCPPESVPAKTEVEANEFNLINLLDINLKVE
jgi:hypothetical protein